MVAHFSRLPGQCHEHPEPSLDRRSHFLDSPVTRGYAPAPTSPRVIQANAGPRVHLPRPGQPVRRHGPRPRRRLRRRARGVPGGRRHPEAEAVQADVRGAGRGTDPDREHPARPDGAFAGRAARAGAEGGFTAAPTRRWWSPGIRWANTPRWPPPAPSPSPTPRGCCGCAARRCSGPCRPARAPWRRCSAPRWTWRRAICAEAAPVAANRRGREVVEPANDNGGGQVVISGHAAAVERAIEIAKAKGVKRAMLLPVSAPFHCALMAPAADAMAEALETTAAGRARPCRWSPTSRRKGNRSGADPRTAGAAGDRHRALARKRRGDDGDGRGQLRRAGRRQGAVRPGASRIAPDAAGDLRRHPAEIEAVLKSALKECSAMFRLDGKTALVTGASGGIGAAIARTLHAQGADGRAVRHPARRAGGTGRRTGRAGASSAPPTCATRRRPMR